MKKLVTFRLDAALLEQARTLAQAENRTLTNFVETLLKRSFQPESPRSASTARTEFVHETQANERR